MKIKEKCFIPSSLRDNHYFLWNSDPGSEAISVYHTAQDLCGVVWCGCTEEKMMDKRI